MAQEWMSLETALGRGIDVSQVLGAIGPRRTGVLYYGAYWGELNQVLSVRVRVETGLRDYDSGRFLPATATWWQVVEYSIGETNVRRHCTSWEYDRGNRVHHGPGDLRLVGAGR